MEGGKEREGEQTKGGRMNDIKGKIENACMVEVKITSSYWPLADHMPWIA